MTFLTARLAAVSLCVLGLSGCGEGPYRVNSTPKMFLPGPDQQALGEARILPDQVVFETPLGFSNAGRLTAPVSFRILGKEMAFEEGATLPSAQVMGTEAARVRGATAILCGLPHYEGGKALLNLTTLGLTSIGQKTASESRVCLIDSDGDNKLDRAILAGVRNSKDAAPVAIPATPYELQAQAPMQGKSVAAIRYRGKTGLVGGHISFDLTVTEEGRALFFNNVRSQVDLKALPATVTVMGTRLVVQSYDPKDGSIMVSRVQGFHRGSYGVSLVPTTRTMYVPIYVPRRR